MTEQTGNNKPNEAEGLAFPLAGNKKLIEEAAATIAVAELVSTHRTWGDLIEPQKDEYRRVARAVLAVFEKALTPTDDEREDEHQAQMIAFETAKLEARNSMRHDPHVWHEALEDALDKVLPAVWHAAAGFRRSEAPAPSRFEHSPDCQPMSFCTCTEPSAERIGCNICGEALPDGEPHLCSEPQGEPSDERVNAALNAHRLSDLLNSGYGPERFHKAPDLSYWHPDYVSNMRAALRAAGVVGQEGESRG